MILHPTSRRAAVLDAIATADGPTHTAVAKLLDVTPLQGRVAIQSLVERHLVERLHRIERLPGKPHRLYLTDRGRREWHRLYVAPVAP